MKIKLLSKCACLWQNSWWSLQGPCFPHSTSAPWREGPTWHCVRPVEWAPGPVLHVRAQRYRGWGEEWASVWNYTTIILFRSWCQEELCFLWGTGAFPIRMLTIRNELSWSSPLPGSQESCPGLNLLHTLPATLWTLHFQFLRLGLSWFIWASVWY